MSKVKDVYDNVLAILIRMPETRGCDSLLIAKVDSCINPVVSDLSYEFVMSHRMQFGLPSCESIVRSRRKAQELNPNLKPSEEVQDARLDKQIEFEDFARSTK